MGKPSFICIGAQKAGTSWLHSRLVQNPNIYMPPFKEIQYFSHLFEARHRAWTDWHIRQALGNAIKWHIINADVPDNSYIERIVRLADPERRFTEDWYFEIFDDPLAEGKICGEITPEYSTIPEDGISYLKELLGDVKIIYIVRHPVDRAVSQIRMNISRSGEASPDWKEHAARWEIFNRGDYATYMPRWRAAFPDMMIIPFGDIARSPRRVINDVEHHIGAPPYGRYANLEKKAHASSGAQVPPEICEWLQSQLDGQISYLREQFGTDFLHRI